MGTMQQPNQNPQDSKNSQSDNKAQVHKVGNNMEKDEPIASNSSKQVGGMKDEPVGSDTQAGRKSGSY